MAIKSFLTLVVLLLLTSTTYALNINNNNTTNLTSLTSFCSDKPNPKACLDSMKFSISININPNILNYLLQSLGAALSEAGKLTTLLSNAELVEKQRGTLQDCKELHQITLSSLQKSMSRIKSGDPRKIADALAYLSGSMTNKVTCLEGLDSATGQSKQKIVDSLGSTYYHVSKSLSMIPKPRVSATRGNKNRKLLGFPRWVLRKNARRFVSDDDDDYGNEYNPSEVLVVSADGSGNFSTISDAINFAPNNSFDRVIIYVKEGVYEENVVIPSYKTNIVLLGDGNDVTLITGNRSVGDGWTTFRSATLAVSGEGFLARDITIQNTAGPEKHQAVAVRVNADFAAMYRCSINGYQDSLYVHSFRQFYRECDISGTVDYICGNAAVVFQACNIISRQPLPGQFTVVTAQSRDDPNEDTGISIQNCSILAAEDLYNNSGSVKSYLGRPWRIYSRTVVIESYIDNFIDPSGWTDWDGDLGLDTLYYGEYDNYGPASVTDNRVDWAGYHVMEYEEALNFTTSYLITGDEWLDSTSFPYDSGF